MKNKEVEAQIEINSGLLTQINSENAINDILRERNEMERNSSAFYSKTAVSDIRYFSEEAEKAKEDIDKAVYSLRDNAVFTATGSTRRSLFGIDGTKKSEEYSFTSGDLLNYNDSTPETAGVVDVLSGFILHNDDMAKKASSREMTWNDAAGSAFDPLSLFGGASSGRARNDAFSQFEEAYNAALTSMGKTTAEMTAFTSEQWLDFYTIMKESGVITDESTLALIDNAEEATQRYLDAIESIKDALSDLTGELYNNLQSSLVDSFKDGENAADSFRKSLENIIESMLVSNIFSVVFDDLFDKFQEDLAPAIANNDLTDEIDIMEKFYTDANNLIPTYNALMSSMQGLANDNNFDILQNSGDELSGLESGIQSMLSSEDVTDIAAQFSSIRDGIWRINSNLEAGNISNFTEIYANSLSYMISMNNNLSLIANNTGDALDILKAVSKKGSNTGLNIN